MRNKNTYQMIAVICLALSALALNSPFAQQRSSLPAPVDSKALHAEILKYKTWTVVNSDPVKLDPIMSVLCAAPVKSGPETPHNDKYIRVYVNDVGREAMLKAKNPTFPAGSIVIKEKLSQKQSETAEFYTIMLKREAGYDPRSGDWQFLIMDSSRARIEKPANVESCQSCHAAWATKSDFVSRAYLSVEQKQKLR